MQQSTYEIVILLLALDPPTRVNIYIYIYIMQV